MVTKQNRRIDSLDYVFIFIKYCSVTNRSVMIFKDENKDGKITKFRILWPSMCIHVYSLTHYI